MLFKSLPPTTKKWFVINHLVQIVYTLVIVLATSIVTTFLVESQISKGSLNLPKLFLPPTPAESEDVAYVERGSPYDNRVVGGATASANVIFHGPRDKKRIAITFDAEMTEGMKANVVSGKVKTSYDKRITDTLTKTNTKATLFLTGMWIELYPKETAELAKNPLFELGSHSYTDSSYYGFCYGLKQLPSMVKIEEIGATEKLLREHAGIDNRLFRFPGGCYSPDDVKLVNAADDVVVHWDVSGADGFNKDVNQVVHNVVDNAQNGSIIILHMNGDPTAPKTAEALPEIIARLKEKGFEFVKVSELLDLPPAPRVNQ